MQIVLCVCWKQYCLSGRENTVGRGLWLFITAWLFILSRFDHNHSCQRMTVKKSNWKHVTVCSKLSPAILCWGGPSCLPRSPSITGAITREEFVCKNSLRPFSHFCILPSHLFYQNFRNAMFVGTYNELSYSMLRNTSNQFPHIYSNGFISFCKLTLCILKPEWASIGTMSCLKYV